MDKFWKDALKITGPVAVIGFLVSLLIEKLYAQEVLDFFGSDRAFYLSIALLSALTIALILSILVYRKPASANKSEQGSQIRTASITKSTVNGDIVFGDKTINQDSKRDQ